MTASSKNASSIRAKPAKAAATPKKTRPARNANLSRARLLTAAMDHFARRSYDQVLLRDIAADAQIDVAMVARYFGSKEGLFGAVIDEALNDPGPFEAEADVSLDLPHRLSRHLLQGPSDSAQGLDPRRLLVVLNSAHDPRVVELLRERIGERVLLPLQGALPGSATIRNAALITAFLIGFGYLHLLLELQPLNSDDDPEGLRAALETVIRAAASA